MAYRDLVTNWHKGILALEEGNWASALKIFQSIETPSSKTEFNIGRIHLLRGDLAEALEAFDQAISKDNCLAVGYYQRGYVCLRLERYEEALDNCRLALAHLRNNSFIDYKQLGLKFVLYAWEVLYNTAAVYCQLGKWQDAERTLEEVCAWIPRNQTVHLSAALEQVQDRLFLQPRSLPEGEFFRPRKEDVEELEAKDFLGRPKVISSAFEEDNASCLQGLQPQGCYNPEMDPSREQEGGYHYLVAPYYPERGGPLKAGSVVYILSMGPGSHASGIFEGQKVCIPVSYLEPMRQVGHSKGEIQGGIPLPPEKVPPNRPAEVQRMQPPPGPTERNVDMNDTDPKEALQTPSAQEEVSPINGRPILLTVHGSYTANIQMSSAPSLAHLRALLQEECQKQAEKMILRYRPTGSDELIPISKDEELRKTWQEVQGSQLTLWCQGKDNRTDRRVLYQMVAQHPYTAQGMEDLNFKEGDILEILSEVNEEWLEGRCRGTVGIFPKCFAVREIPPAAAAAAADLPLPLFPGTVASPSGD
ncbi:NADPH oxidase activator 1 isoform X2 [Sphaerodactylus townsendi]|uniref:NADPH oxidase activator 1 isoform X2 n=1 Tax=Sphaerodactylus townsendi TaxID=933632 RepID=UPI0020266D10|nr:NADPH oxidase activator 1 isoform X2 [Sphaerodactylus townsendi]